MSKEILINKEYGTLLNNVKTGDHVEIPTPNEVSNYLVIDMLKFITRMMTWPLS